MKILDGLLEPRGFHHFDLRKTPTSELGVLSLTKMNKLGKIEMIKYLFIAFVLFSLGCSQYCDGDFLRNGLFIEYYKNGNKRHETQIVNCLCSGITKNYYGDEKIYSTNDCVGGKYNGFKNFYDREGNLMAQSTYKMNLPIDFKIFSKKMDTIIFDNVNGKKLYNNHGTVIYDSTILEVFNSATEIKVLNDTLFAVSDYRSLVLLTPQLKIKFNLAKLKNPEFEKLYEVRQINRELWNKFLQSGIDFELQSDSISLVLYYIDKADYKFKNKRYLSPLNKN